MLRQVYETLKKDSVKGDFIYLIEKDMDQLNITFTEEEIQSMTKPQWKKYVHSIVSEKAFEYLKEENENKTKTKHIQLKKLCMSEYLVHNKNTFLSKIIFSARSGTLDLKAWNEWKYNEKACVMCKIEEENFDHFMKCLLYGPNNLEIKYTGIFENTQENQYKVAIEIKRRSQIRKAKLAEVGLPPLMAPLLQDTVELQ
jgi:hypothetical protein